MNEIREPLPESMCPECVQGKHRNCDGRTWDVENDDYRACECPDPEHDHA